MTLPSPLPWSSVRRLVVVLALLLAASTLTAAPGTTATPDAARASASASTAERAYAKDALAAINAARARKKLVEVRSQACMTRYAQSVAEKDAAAGKLTFRNFKAVSKTCRLHYAIGTDAFGRDTGAATINQLYLKDSFGRQVLLQKRNRITGIGAAQAADGQWYFMVVMSDFQLKG